MRIMLDSFEDWYGRQFHYKKVDGPEPGQLLPASWTVPEVAGILGLNRCSVYELIKNHAPFQTIKVDGQTRILKESFDRASLTIRNGRTRHRRSFWTLPFRWAMWQSCLAYTATVFITW